MLKINFLGDSITQATYSDIGEDNYVNLVGKTLNCLTRNYGLSGTRIAKSNNPSPIDGHKNDDFIIRSLDMDNDADIVFVLGGINDYAHGWAQIGDPNSVDPYTFYGALNVLSDILLKKYSKNKVVFILPLPSKNEDDPYGWKYEWCQRKIAPLSRFREAIKEVAIKNDFKVLTFDEYFFDKDTINSSLFYDGVHPSKLGHEKMAEIIVKYIKENKLEK